LIGYLAGDALNASDYNTLVGAAAGSGATSGEFNSSFGRFSGNDNSTGSNNTLLGYRAGYYNSTGSDNTIIGFEANISHQNLALYRTVVIGGSANAEQNDSIVIGHGAVSHNVDSVVIGTGATNSYDNSVAIGHGATTHAANTIAIGNSTTVSWEPSADSVTTLGTSDYRFEDVFSNKLSVNAATGNAAQIDLFADAGSSNNDQWSIKAADAGDFTISSFASNSDVNILTISNNGNATLSGNLTVNSDKRLKQSIKPIKGAQGLLSQIEGVTYFWKSDLKRDDKKQYGLIAQNIEAVIPELISESKSGIKSVNYQALIPVLINASREQQDQIDAQNQQLDIQNIQILKQQKQIEKQQRQIELLLSKLASE